MADSPNQHPNQSRSQSCAEAMAREANSTPTSPPIPRSSSASSDQEYDFVEEPPQDFYCAVSLELLIDPHQTGCCGHHLSSGVVVRLQRERRPCPMCQNPTFNTHADLYLRRKVKELQVRCRYKTDGCEWVGDLGNKEAHLRTCPKQPWSCEHCTFSGLREAEQGHIAECQLVPVRCPNNCNRVQIKRAELSSHLENVCPLQPMTCSFAHVGCIARLSRSEMENHIQNMQAHHMMLTCSVNLDLTRQLNEKILQKDEQIEALKSQVSQMRSELGERVGAVESSVVAQSEWMESTNQPRQPEEGQEEEEDKLSEEVVKNIVANELQQMEERMMQALKKEVEQLHESVTASLSAGESRDQDIRTMMEHHTQTLKTVEDKVNMVSVRVEQDGKRALDSSKQVETVMTKMMEIHESNVNEGEERMKTVVNNIEKVITEQMKASLENVETVALQAKETVTMVEGVRKEIDGLGKRVEGEIRQVENIVQATELKITKELTDVKTHVTAVNEKIEAVQNEIMKLVIELPTEEVGKGKGRGPDLENNGVEVHTIDKSTKPAPSPKPKRDLHPKRMKTSSKQSTPPSEVGPAKTESDVTPPELSLMSLSPSSPAAKPVSEEDANCKPKRIVTSVSHPLSHQEIVHIPHDGIHHRPPCQFTIEQFSKLKELNKEWRSPPFYSPRGYKMCLGVWPNGFRSGANTHVSVEFYKMRDVNTDKLRWPVKLPIHIRIYNYRTKKWEKEHVNGDTFSRGKVSSELETSGYALSHRLLPHEELDNYLLDDNFRIQVYKCEMKP